MRLPILYTMSWPERVPCSEQTWPRLDFRKCSELTFKEPDHAKYPSMELAYAAGRCAWDPALVTTCMPLTYGTCTCSHTLSRLTRPCMRREMLQWLLHPVMLPSQRTCRTKADSVASH